MQYPWELSQGEILENRKLLKMLGGSWEKTSWFGFGALYSASSKHGAVEKKLLKTAIKKHCSRLVLIDKKIAALLSLLQKPLHKVLSLDVEMALDSIFYNSVYLGNPMKTSMKSLYWRKKISIPDNLDPDRDRCGVVWLCHVVPFRAADISGCSEIVERVCSDCGFEPNLAFLNISERKLHFFVAIIYDRETAGDDERAMCCHDILFKQLNNAGYSSYRLGIQSMASISSFSDTRVGALKDLKTLFDPNDIISPGRYDFRHVWKRA
jgi:4-cresol dehydrogenase (hydroxylating)